MQKQLCGNRFSPFMEKMFDWDFGQSVPIQESPRGAGVRRGTGLVPPPLAARSAFCRDCGLTKHCRSDGFLMVLPPGPTAKSLRFLTIYHCKCLTYLLASVQFVCIITLFLEGRGLGLLLYEDHFVIYGLYMLVKGNKMGIFGTCFLRI